MPARIHKAKLAFQQLTQNNEHIETAIENLKYWLMHPAFEEYEQQIEGLIEQEKFEVLFDSFYKTIEFGTGGRRGRVGIGPNRINHWTIAAAIQVHCQYLMHVHGQEIKRGVVIAYDVRQYTDSSVYSNSFSNPVWGITSKDLAETSATVYVNNGIPVHFFNEIAPTPLLSFAIREIKAIAGINISASHNPPDYNGVKIFCETGGQLLPPLDQRLADEINNKVNIYEVDWGIFSSNMRDGQISYVSSEIDEKYYQAVAKLIAQPNTSARALYSPLHGTGKRTIYKALRRLELDIHLEGSSSIPSGEFETVPNRIANPELPEVYERLEPMADEMKADLIITSDPDADRVGISVKSTNHSWVTLNGNQIYVLLLYIFSKIDEPKDKIVLATRPVTLIADRIAEKNNAIMEHQYLPGFKYLAHRMDALEKTGEIDRFLMAGEDAHGHIVGNYARDKDALIGSLFLIHYAGILKEEGKTLLDLLDEIYAKFGYFESSQLLYEFKFSYMQESADALMAKLRKAKEKGLGDIRIRAFVDYLTGDAIISETDRMSRNMLEYLISPDSNDVDYARIIIRPSGTEPKIKVYMDIGKYDASNLSSVKLSVNDFARALREKLSHVLDFDKLNGV